MSYKNHITFPSFVFITAFVGYGYRPLRSGEIIEKGDEYEVRDEEWTRYIYSIGQPSRMSGRSRRPLVPPAGYVLADLDDPLTADQFVMAEGFSEPAPSSWHAHSGLVNVRDALLHHAEGSKAAYLWALFKKGPADTPIYRILAAGERIARGDLRNARDRLETACSEREQAREMLDDAKAELLTKDNVIETQRRLLETQQKNASGNAVLLTKTGFSKPVDAPQGAVAYMAFGKVFNKTESSDGFGRSVFTESEPKSITAAKYRLRGDSPAI